MLSTISMPAHSARRYTYEVLASWWNIVLVFKSASWSPTIPRFMSGSRALYNVMYQYNVMTVYCTGSIESFNDHSRDNFTSLQCHVQCHVQSHVQCHDIVTWSPALDLINTDISLHDIIIVIWYNWCHVSMIMTLSLISHWQAVSSDWVQAYMYAYNAINTVWVLSDSVVQYHDIGLPFICKFSNPSFKLQCL